jgi:hypothetical protein
VYRGRNPHIPERGCAVHTLEIYLGKHDHREECERNHCGVCITGARLLKLYSFLDTLSEFVLYCDKKSAIYIQKVAHLPKIRTSDYKGNLTNKVKGINPDAYIEDFVSGDPEKFAKSDSSRSSRTHAMKRTVKGIAPNYTKSQTVNFTALRLMILEDGVPLHVHNRDRIKQTHGCAVVSGPE